MSVISTEINMPNSCAKCEYRTRCGIGLANGWIDNARDEKCPLKSIDGLIEEIKDLFIIDVQDDEGEGYCTCIPLYDTIEAIKKYCKS
jgi:hypothetical protein